jgi:hypothetical protein
MSKLKTKQLKPVEILNVPVFKHILNNWHKQQSLDYTVDGILRFLIY